jgi:hypothetical protein
VVQRKPDKYRNQEIASKLPIHWVSSAIETLQSHNVIQLFEIVNYLNAHSTVIEKFVSYSVCKNKTSDFIQLMSIYKTWLLPHCHVGFAWAARRKFLFDIGGLFDKDISATNDAMMAKTFAKEKSDIRDWLNYRIKNDFFVKAVEDWQTNTHKYLDSSLSFVQGWL